MLQRVKGLKVPGGPAISPSNPRRIFLHCSVFSATLPVMVRADVFGLWAALFPLYCGLSGGILSPAFLNPPRRKRRLRPHQRPACGEHCQAIAAFPGI